MENFLLLKILFFVSKIASDFANYPDLSISNKYVCSIPSKFEDYEYSTAVSSAPPILSVDGFYQERTVNEPFEVECTGHKPLTWIIHNYVRYHHLRGDYPRCLSPILFKVCYNVDLYEGHEYNITTVSITETEFATNTTQLYRSVLAITDLSFTDTRLYHCVYNKRDELNTDNSFYLYVNDDTNLLLPVPLSIQFCQKHDLTVPCRPTHSRANVTLWKIFPIRPKVQIPLENSIVSYDPSEGFRILQKSFFYDGEFLCQAQLDGRIEEKKISIDFDGLYPNVIIQTETPSSETIKYFSTNKLHKITCIVDIYQGDDVWFEWRKCEDVKCKSFSSRIVLDGEQNSQELVKKCNEDGILETRNSIEVNATESGELICVIGRYQTEIEENSLFFIVSDVAGGFEIISSTMNPVEGDNVTVECRANIIHYSSITFQHSSSIPNAEYFETNGSTSYSLTSEIKFLNISKDFNETVTCAAQSTEQRTTEYRSVILLAQPASKPKFLSDNHVEDIKLRHDLSQPILNCSVAGVPTPVIKWFKDGKPIRNSTAMDIIGGGQQLLIKLLTKTLVEGDYVCNVTNKEGSIQRSFKVRDVIDSPTAISPTVWGVILAIGLVILLVAIICCVRLIRHKKLEKAELNALIDDLNHVGRLDKVDPNTPIDEQVDCLPYDKKWEFNENRLKLGTILGQGAFGKVVEAQAIGITNDKTITVAVKTTKDRANIPQIRLLISELKILIHIGKHLNVANLLGAVTKNIIRGDVMIIVEYCRFGNLRNYLIRAKNKFINQVDPKTGFMDFKINHDQDLETDQIFDENSTSEGGFINPLRGSDDLECKTISTSDLISYSYQVSKGMSYLSSKKILHRDLAARNVLLADNDIVKICDFGLAKDCYHSNYYKLQGNGALPIKWLAIESLEKKIFTTESDAWSYGILLWELFTLGGDPYPGMHIDEEFLNRLKRGYRMDTPKYAPKCIYSLMLKCWDEKPESRPTFEEMGKELGDCLQESPNSVYLQLETEYVKMSSVQFEIDNEINNENGFDYLKMNKAASAENKRSVGTEPSGSTEKYKYVTMDKETKPEMIELVSLAKIDPETSEISII